MALPRVAEAGPGWLGRPRSLDEMRDSILAKLAALDRASAKA